MVLGNLIFQAEVVEQRFRAVVLPHHDQQASDDRNQTEHGWMLSSNMLLRNLILLIDVTFSTPTTNFDNRSFGINDEVNLAVLDPAVAARLTENFEEDISHSRRITLKEWNRRSLYERSLESIGWFLERQQ